MCRRRASGAQMGKLWVVPTALVVVLLGALPAHASFPGRNGRIAFATFSNVFSAAHDGHGLHQLSDPHSAKNRGPSWSADGMHIAFACHGNAYSASRGSEICVMRADGSHEHQVTKNNVSDTSPSWSPDGRWIAFIRTEPSGNQGDVWIMRSDGTDERNVTPDSFPDFYPRWSPDGDEILYMSSRPTASPFSAVLPSDQQDLFAVTVGDESIRNVTNSASHEDSGDWSPNGRKIVFTRYSESDSGGWGIYVMRASGGQAIPITRDIFTSSPAWSPDGRWIVFSAITEVGSDGSLNGKNKIFMIRPDGSRLTTVTRSPRRSYYNPDWQPLLGERARLLTRSWCRFPLLHSRRSPALRRGCRCPAPRTCNRLRHRPTSRRCLDLLRGCRCRHAR